MGLATSKALFEEVSIQDLNEAAFWASPPAFAWFYKLESPPYIDVTGASHSGLAEW